MLYFVINLERGFILTFEHLKWFFIGATTVFSIISTIIMNPEQMLRWLFNSDPIDTKVEKALSKPSEIAIKLEEEKNNAVNKLISVQEHTDKIEAEFKNKIKTLNDEKQSYINTIQKLRNQKIQIYNKNNDFKNPFPDEAFVLYYHEPMILFNGQYSMSFNSRVDGGCRIEIVSFINDAETSNIILYEGKPKSFTAAKKDYIMHFLGFKSNGTYLDGCKIKIFPKL